MIVKGLARLIRLFSPIIKRVCPYVPAPFYRSYRRAKLWYYNKSNYGHLDYTRGERYLTVFMDINNTCNLKCIMCSRGSVPDRVRNLTPGEFERIGDQCFYNAKTLQVCCAWELSISKYAPDILRLLPKYDIPHTSIITNGNFLSDELLESFFESSLNEVTVSIGEATKETYEKIRVKGNFERTIGNIKRLVDRKKTLGSERPRVTVNLTIMRSNIDELIDFVDLAADIGIEFIRGRHMMFLEECPVEGEILVNDVERTNEIIRCARKAAKAKNIPFDIPHLDTTPKVDYSCYRPWTTLYISSDGSLSVCPRIKVYEHLGNLLEMSFEELYYFSEPIKKLRRAFIAGRHNVVCRWCMSGVKEREQASQKF